MKEFRVAKCLFNGNITDCAIFKDGSRKKMIQIDDEYGRYFCVDNELNAECKTVIKYSFADRIKDAVETIRSGNGDCILQSKFFGTHDRVVYFLDRKIGEELRRKFIEGWKNARFGYAIKIRYKDSFLGYSVLNTENSLGLWVEGDEMKTFSSAKDAEDYVGNLLNSAKKYAVKLENRYLMCNTIEDKKKCIRAILDEIKNEYGDCSVVRQFMRDILDDDCKMKNEYGDLDEMGYKIVQVVMEVGR